MQKPSDGRDESGDVVHICADPDLDRLTLVFRGSLEIPDLIEVLRRIVEVDGYRPGMNALYDLRDARISLEAGDLQKLRLWAEGSLDTWGTGWRLATVTSTDLMFGYSRMMASLFADAPWAIGNFRDVGSASAWLEEGRRRD